MKALWEGVFPLKGLAAPQMSKGLMGFASYLPKACAGTESLQWKAARQIFNPDLVAQMRIDFERNLDVERSRYTDDEAGVGEFIVRNRTRRRTARNPLQVYTNDVLPFTPGLSKRSWDLGAGAPKSLRARGEAFPQMLAVLAPKSLTIPVLSGTQPYRLNAGLNRNYLLAQAGLYVAPRPRAAAILRRLGFANVGPYWKPSTLVETAIAEVDEAHEDLSPAGVAAVRKAEAPYDPVVEKARELLFYWNSWRRMMSGRSF
jgi:hypothetical protein